MRAFRAWLVRLAGVFQRAPRDRELREELDSHLQMHISDNVRAGMNHEEARRQALIKLGGITQTQMLYRDRRGLPFVDALAQDVRYSVRVLSKSRGFTFVAIITLALGIGVNTAVFTAFDALALRPRRVKDPQRLVSVLRTAPGESRSGVSYPDYIYFRDHSKTLSDLSLFGYGIAVTSSDLPATGPESSSRFAGAFGFQLPQLLEGSAQPIGCDFVSGNYLSMYGATPLLGRILSPEDDQPNAAPVVVMSGNFWQRWFHSDPEVVGSVLHLNGAAFTVVGVTPFNYLAGLPAVPDLWAPVAAKMSLGFSAQDLANRLVSAGFAGGRLRPGVTLSDAQAELNVLAEQLRAAYP
jgi:putative ABC transport system permease protein